MVTVGGQGGVSVPTAWDRQSAISWAQRQGYAGHHLKEFEEFASVLEKTCVSPGKVKVQSHLDKGAFGSIHKGKFGSLPVAVKRVSHEVFGIKPVTQITRELCIELEVVSSIKKHPHVCEFIGAVARFPRERDQDQAMSMMLLYELCANCSLSGLLYGVKPFKKRYFSLHEKIRVVSEIASGLSHLHELGILHRDINPRNVLLSRNLRAKICDFGFARCTKGEKYQPTTVSGTAEYMSPEHMLGQVLTLKSDVWSVGALMWELAMEVPPWQVASGVEDNHDVIIQLVVKDGQRLQIPGDWNERDMPKGIKDEYSKTMAMTFRTFPDNRPSMEELSKILSDMHLRCKYNTAAACLMSGMRGTGACFGSKRRPDIPPLTTLRTVDVPVDDRDDREASPPHDATPPPGEHLPSQGRNAHLYPLQDPNASEAGRANADASAAQTPAADRQDTVYATATNNLHARLRNQMVNPWNQQESPVPDQQNDVLQISGDVGFSSPAKQGNQEFISPAKRPAQVPPLWGPSGPLWGKDSLPPRPTPLESPRSLSPRYPLLQRASSPRVVRNQLAPPPSHLSGYDWPGGIHMSGGPPPAIAFSPQPQPRWIQHGSPGMGLPPLPMSAPRERTPPRQPSVQMLHPPLTTVSPGGGYDRSISYATSPQMSAFGTPQMSFQQQQPQPQPQQRFNTPQASLQLQQFETSPLPRFHQQPASQRQQQSSPNVSTFTVQLDSSMVMPSPGGGRIPSSYAPELSRGEPTPRFAPSLKNRFPILEQHQPMQQVVEDGVSLAPQRGLWSPQHQQPYSPPPAPYTQVMTTPRQNFPLVHVQANPMLSSGPEPAFTSPRYA